MSELLLLVAIAEVEEFTTAPPATFALLALLLAGKSLKHLLLRRQVCVVLTEPRVDERGRMALVEESRKEECLSVC